MNHSEGGRRLEQVCEDIKDTDLSNADSVIVHVGTNNLQRDTKEQMCVKYQSMFKSLKLKVPESCAIAISSIAPRTDKPDLSAKLEHVNQRVSQLCDDFIWTFIDNHAVKDLCPDRLHPNKRGMSFLARNFQDFLRCAHPSIFREGRKKSFERRRNVMDFRRMPMWLNYLMSGRNV